MMIMNNHLNFWTGDEEYGKLCSNISEFKELHLTYWSSWLVSDWSKDKSRCNECFKRAILFAEYCSRLEQYLD